MLEITYLLASELIERSGLGTRAPYVEPARHLRALGGSFKSESSTFKSHVVTEEISRHLDQGNAAALYIYRDIRDVVSSLQQKNKMLYEGYALKELVLGLLCTDLQWRSAPKVYIARYEDVIGNESEEITNIAEFLGIAVQRATVTAIADLCSYRGAKAIIDDAIKEDWVEVNPTNIYHRCSLLHKNHLQGGNIGRYKSDLERQQLQIVEEHAGEWLEMCGYVGSCQKAD